MRLHTPHLGDDNGAVDEVRDAGEVSLLSGASRWGGKFRQGFKRSSKHLMNRRVHQEDPPEGSHPAYSYLEAPRCHGWGADADSTGDHSTLVSGDRVLVKGDVHLRGGGGR